MKKIPNVFERDWNGDTSRVLPVVLAESDWVIRGEGVATRKWDGTAVRIWDGDLFKRYDAKHGKTPPDGFYPAQDPDPKTGHWPGWLRVSESKPEDKWILEARSSCPGTLADGTYEACGPKIGGNPDGFDKHILILHGSTPVEDFYERSYENIRDHLATVAMEGFVYHHPDGRMAKVKRRDFGFVWPVRP